VLRSLGVLSETVQTYRRRPIGSVILSPDASCRWTKDLS